MKIFLFFVMGLFFCFDLNAQVKSQFSKRGLVGRYGVFNADTLESQIDIVGVDIKKALDEDEFEKDMGLPFRFGISNNVNLSLENSGKWFEINDGRVWKLKIRSKQAYSINLIFDKLFLSDSSILYIYNENKTMLYGPVTKDVISGTGIFSTDLIQGNTIIIELFEPSNERNKNQLEISKVIHGYKDMFIRTKNYGDSWDYPCQVDVRCYSFQNQSDGVAMIILADGTRYCSGSLLNNVCQDFTPNILTAFHCIDVGDHLDPCEATAFDGAISTAERNRAQAWVFRFQYISPSCNGPEPPSSTWYSFSGATYRAGWQPSDFALLQMTQRPSGNTNIKFQGWNRTATLPQSGISLHHPMGDVMKVSWYNTPATRNTFVLQISNTCKNLNYDTGNVLMVPFTGGTIQPGSSGGPLYDPYYRMVGQVLGGPEGCAPITMFYGRLYRSWGIDNNGGFLAGRNINNSLGPWLTNNPTVVSTNTIPIPFINGPNIVCTTNSIYTISNIPQGQSVTWSASPANLFAVYSGSGTTATLRAASSSSQGGAVLTFQLISGGNCPNSYFTKNIWVGVPNSSAYLYVRDYYTKVNNPTLCLNAYNYLEAYMNTSYREFNVDEYGWQMISGGSLYSPDPPYNIAIVQPYSSPVSIKYRAHNACGWSTWVNNSLYATSCGYFYNYFPNPADNELTIEAIPNQADSSSLYFLINFEVNLYNADQELVLSQVSSANKVVLNTSNLKKGNYILHIIDMDQTIRKHIILK